MAKVPSKGTVLQQEISMSFTAVAQLTEISCSGIEVETWESRTLDGSAGIAHDQTGYVSGGEVSISGLFDPALSGHQSLMDIITTPADQNWKVIFADSGTTEWPYTSAGTSWEWTATMSDGLKFSSTHKVDGLATLPT